MTTEAISEHILYERQGRVAIIRLNRPEKLNAMTLDMDGDWARAIRKANEEAEVGAIVVTGNGRGFCAGADMKERFKRRLEMIETGTQPAAPSGAGWIDLVRGSKPLIAAVNGVAVGMGLTLILPFDVILASTEASFTLAFVRVGLVPELASTHYLVSRMGFGKASELMLTGRTIKADEAVAGGLADRLVPHKRLMDEALALAEMIAANPAPQLKMTKMLITQNACETDMEAVCAREGEALEKARRTPEHKAAIERFTARQG
ncbi:MAG: enoyl-CoA hydratase/isomerase family protein [Alphaproteobacteria bacterium]|nr:enoyl-CoA hydratase/isomerase family protein [Alphaproteobacteria bacterium]